MLPGEITKKIQMLHFSTRYRANGLFTGQYTSAFKGKGMEFAEVREYTEGDDVRDIDWNVTARFGHPFVKIFSEERELTVVFLVDVSASNLFGTRGRFKREAIAEVVGILAFAAIRTNDKVGAVLFAGDVIRFIPPRKGASHVWRLIREVFSEDARAGLTDLAAPLDYANRVLRRHAIVFCVSDFLGADVDGRFALSLSLAARKHDVTAIRVEDPSERVLPDMGLARFTDPETGRVTVADTSDKRLRARWNREIQEADARLKKTLARARVDLVSLHTDKSVVEPLAAYFREREKRK
jgi:uncharacterized protein (DUF58 family)